MIKLMIDDVKLAVTIGNEMGNPFNTNIGTPQGDCISPIQYYSPFLANALKCRNSRTPTEIADQDYGIDETQRPMITPTHLMITTTSNHAILGLL